MSDRFEYAEYIEWLVDQGSEPDVDDVEYDPDEHLKLKKEHVA